MALRIVSVAPVVMLATVVLLASMIHAPGLMSGRLANVSDAWPGVAATP